MTEIDDCKIKLTDRHSTTQRCVAGVSKAPLSPSTSASRRTRVNAAMRERERERSMRLVWRMLPWSLSIQDIDHSNMDLSTSPSAHPIIAPIPSAATCNIVSQGKHLPRFKALAVGTRSRVDVGNCANNMGHIGTFYASWMDSKRRAYGHTDGRAGELGYSARESTGPGVWEACYSMDWVIRNDTLSLRPAH